MRNMVYRTAIQKMINDVLAENEVLRRGGKVEPFSRARVSRRLLKLMQSTPAEVNIIGDLEKQVKDLKEDLYRARQQNRVPKVNS